MAAAKFNSLGGFSAGIPPIPVIDANGNIISNVYTTGNVTANVVFADSLRFPNGAGFVAGANTEVQFNSNGVLDSSPTFVFDSDSQRLTVSNFTVTENSLLGDVSTVKILGGNNGYFLQTDGAGNLTWAVGGSGGSGSPGGSNAQIQFNNNGSFGGSIGFTFNNSSNTLSVQNANVGNITAINANVVSLNGNSFSANTINSLAVINANSIVASGNITVGNRLNANTISSSTGNIQVIGNISVGSQAKLKISNVSQLSIDGGNNGYFLQTDGAGNLTWSAAGNGTGSPGGSNTQIQYNKSGLFTGSPFLTFNDSTNIFQISGKLIANSIQMGAGIYKYSDTTLIETTTNSNQPSQIIYSMPADTVIGIDFEVTASDATKINTFMLSSQVHGTSVDFTEYGGIYTNGSVGDFEVVYNPGSIIAQPSIEVLVTPVSSSTTTYRLLTTVYFE